MTEEQKEEVPAGQRLATLLTRFTGGPTADDIEGYKLKHGDVYISAMSEDEVFIFRAVKRVEWRDLQVKLSQGELDALSQEELLVKICVLWSSVTSLESKAGTVATLSEQIMQNSNFMSPAAAASLVGRL